VTGRRLFRPFGQAGLATSEHDLAADVALAPMTHTFPRSRRAIESAARSVMPEVDKEGERYSADRPQAAPGFFLKGSHQLDWGMKNRLARVFSPASGRTVKDKRAGYALRALACQGSRRRARRAPSLCIDGCGAGLVSENGHA
jgi:hypothetical protein